MPYDNTGSLSTGIAVANPGTAPASIQVTVRDEQGGVIETKTVSLDSGAKKAFMLPQLVGSAGAKRGLLQIYSASGPITAVALRFNGPAFTTVPVVAIDPATSP